jgi:hypothetical protein
MTAFIEAFLSAQPGTFASERNGRARRSVRQQDTEVTRRITSSFAPLDRVIRGCGTIPVGKQL